MEIKKLLAVFTILIVCFLPIVPISYENVVWEQVSEEYTVFEPYTVWQEAEKPYRVLREQVHWQETEDFRAWRTQIHSEFIPPPEGLSGYWVRTNIWITKYQKVDIPVTRFREVAKPLLVYKPIMERVTSRTSVLGWIFRKN